MNPTLKSILAALAGFISAAVSIAIVEAIGHAIYPAPSNLDMNDKAAMTAYVQGLPVGALLFVILGWVVGVIVGSLVARAMVPARTLMLSAIIGMLIEIATIINLSMIPHPTWFAITALIVIPVVAFALGYLTQPKK